MVLRYEDGSETEYFYPPLDPAPLVGSKVCMLTDGNQQIVGSWPKDHRAQGIKGWARLTSRNKDKERQLGYLPAPCISE